MTEANTQDKVQDKERIILKLTGEIFPIETTDHNNSYDFRYAKSVAEQIKKLKDKYKFGIVIGGGNIFRGSKLSGPQTNITPLVGHNVGMLATCINGLLFADLLKNNNISCKVLSVIPYPGISSHPNPIELEEIIEKYDALVFVGGTGNSYVSTDTAGIFKALYIKAKQVWKGTKVDGIYDKDPLKNKDAKQIKKINYHDALEKNIGIIDKNALVLAQEHNLEIRFFDIFKDNALITATKDKDFGSIINLKESY